MMIRLKNITMLALFILIMDMLTPNFDPPKVASLRCYTILILYHILGVILGPFSCNFLIYVLGTPMSVLAFLKENWRLFCTYKGKYDSRESYEDFNIDS